MSWSPKVIVITSDEPYSKMWHTQLIYTEHFAEQHQVFFIDPPDKWQFSNFFASKKTPRKIHATLKVFKYTNRFPSFIPYFQSLNDRYNDRIIAEALKKDNAKAVLFWHYDSYRSALCTPVLTGNFIIKRVYHVIDPFYHNPINQLLCELSDLIIITSQRHASYYSAYQKKLMHVPQVLNVKRVRDFLQNTSAINVIKDRPYLVLLGTLSEYLDYDWLIYLAENLKIDLHLIGQVLPLPTQEEKYKKLIGYKNIISHGVMAQEEFYPMIAGAEAGIAVYNSEKRNAFNSPLKALNYMAAGIPVVTNIDCEIPELLDKSIFYADNEKEMLEIIRKIHDKHMSFDKIAADSYIESHSTEIAVTEVLNRLSQ